MINLPQSPNISLPDVPESVRKEGEETYKYLVDLRRNIIKVMGKLVDNDAVVQNAINAGASGTYPSTGISYIFVNGIFTSTT